MTTSPSTEIRHSGLECNTQVAQGNTALNTNSNVHLGSQSKETKKKKPFVPVRLSKVSGQNVKISDDI